jgi:GNAT superfamily N-acetyltransferase
MSAYSLRPIEPTDMETLFRVYASTRVEELSVVAWSDEQKEAFLRQQFEAQHAHYQQHYTGASFDVILVEGRPAGRLYVGRWAREIRMVDIALLPEHRGQGLGAAIVGDLLEEGRRSGKPVSIHVERYNPALRLYERLGFRVLEDKGVYLLMEWSPSAPAQAERN